MLLSAILIFSLVLSGSRSSDVPLDVSIFNSPTIFPLLFNPGFDIAKVAEQAEALPSHSWEYGTACQALLELYNPEISVFGSRPFPVPKVSKEDVRALKYAHDHIVIGEGKDGLSDGDGAVGDPASLGVCAVLLGKSDRVYANAATSQLDYVGKSDRVYANAATSQLDYVINDAPRWSNGAISHRADVLELWSDFIYMAPPFIAYYAADTGNEDLLRQSVDQCRHYRDVLRTNVSDSTPYKGAWEHIIGMEKGKGNEDLGLWSTGNSWACAGMARVLATVLKAPKSTNDHDQSKYAWRSDGITFLTTAIKEILDGAMRSNTDHGLLRNYLEKTSNDDGHGFGEISGSSLLAAVAYRMAVMFPKIFGEKYIHWAEGIREVIAGNDAYGHPHVTKAGIVTPAVNPMNSRDTKQLTTGSPEGNCFAVILYSSWRDCILAERCPKRVDKRQVGRGHQGGGL